MYSGTRISGGEKTGEPCITVGVIKKYTPVQLQALNLEPIPANIMGLETDVVETHVLSAPPSLILSTQPSDDPRTHQQKFRPTVPGGVSAIVCGSTACTTTLWVWSDALKKPVLLQNWHCEELNACDKHLIIQQSPYDGGKTPDDAIARFLAGNIENTKTDSAVSEGGYWGVGEKFVPSDEFATQDIFGLGSYHGIDEVKVGDHVVKSGRTTGITEGDVQAIDGAANIQYPDKVRQKEDLIVTSNMLQGGDSSSPMKLFNNREIGLGFAGQGFGGSDLMSVFIKPKNILEDPAFTSLSLNFDYDFGPIIPPPPVPEPPPTPDPNVCLLNCIAQWDGQDTTTLISCFMNCLSSSGVKKRTVMDAIYNKLEL